MTLDEYTQAVEELEAGRIPAALPGAFASEEAERRYLAGFLARELRGIAWANGARPEAMRLIARCRAIEMAAE